MLKSTAIVNSSTSLIFTENLFGENWRMGSGVVMNGRKNRKVADTELNQIQQ
jgi:hypothetical protein